MPTLPTLAAALRQSWRSWMTWEPPPPDPSSVWLPWLGTAVFSAVLAAGFMLMSFLGTAHSLADWMDARAWLHRYIDFLMVTLVIGATNRGLFMLARRLASARIQAWTPRRRTLFAYALALLGTAIGWPIGMALVWGGLEPLRRMPAADTLGLVVVMVVANGLIGLYLSLRARALRAQMQAGEARWQLLQGQMEPHFLFNTLATVISLVEADAPRARQLLESLTDYLRASMSSLREGETSLGAELELATRYLELMRARMGERLRFVIDADAGARGAAIAPLLLQPLIENAVKHGLEPEVDGGTVHVRATRLTLFGQDMLQVCVDDDGCGPAAAAARAHGAGAAAPQGHGIALDNLRERLRARFGQGARLTLDDLRLPGGTRASLLLPYRVAAVTAQPTS